MRYCVRLEGGVMAFCGWDIDRGYLGCEQGVK